MLTNVKSWRKQDSSESFYLALFSYFISALFSVDLFEIILSGI